MKTLKILSTMACFGTAIAFAQSMKPGVTLDNPADLMADRWRVRVAQDAAKKGIVRSPLDPLVKDLTPLFSEIKTALPAGKIFGQEPLAKPDDDLKFLELQVQTTLDETPRTRFVRALTIEVKKEDGGESVQERLVRYLLTPNPFEAGPIQGPEPGDLCYHATHYRGASEIFIRGNILVAVYCLGPTAIPKLPEGRPKPGTPGIDPRQLISERTGVQGFCSENVAPLALQIDRIVQNHLERR